MLTEDFQYTVDTLGQPRDQTRLTEDQLSFFESHLPASYVDFMRAFGLGSYFDRGFQFVDPREFRSIAALIFKADPDFSHKDCHIVAYTAFGELVAWSERHWVTDIDLLTYEVKNTNLAPHDLGGPPLELPVVRREVTADFMASSMLPWDDDARECWDFWGDPMFNRCVKQHGPLQMGECYGFFPSLGMFQFGTKTKDVDHIKRVSALEHFTMIAQLKPFNLVRTVRGKTVIVREIG